MATRRSPKPEVVAKRREGIRRLEDTMRRTRDRISRINDRITRIGRRQPKTQAGREAKSRALQNAYRSRSKATATLHDQGRRLSLKRSKLYG